MDYNTDFYILTVETDNGEKREIASIQFKNRQHRTYFVSTGENERIEYIIALQEGQFPTYLKKPYAVIPEQQEDLEKALKEEDEKYGRRILRTINSDHEGLSSLHRENVSDLPRSYGLYLYRIRKSDINKLLNGEILYDDDEYTFAIGMSDEDINHEKDS